MALYARLIGLEEPKISVHDFRGVMAEFKRGNITGAEAAAFLQLDAGEITEATTLRDRIGTGQGTLTAQEIEDVLFLGESGFPAYSTEAAIKTRFGV